MFCSVFFGFLFLIIRFCCRLKYPLIFHHVLLTENIFHCLYVNAIYEFKMEKMSSSVEKKLFVEIPGKVLQVKQA